MPVPRLFLPFAILVSLGSLPLAHAAGGQLFYNRITAGGATALQRIDGDGTGDQTITLNLPSSLYPTVSRNGRVLMVTSPDPGRPFKLSQNVYAIDLATGNFGRATGYSDEFVLNGVRFDDDLAKFFGNTTISSYKINFPFYKALSPDGSRVVVANLFKSGSINQGTPLDPTEVQASSGRFPLVDVYNLSDALPAGAYVYLSPQERDGFNQGGDGVDWHPGLNEVVAAVASDIPATGTSGRTSMEGTVLAVFSPGSLSPFVRKLTNPVGQIDATFTGTQTILTAFGPHDYAPSISPDGTRVAFVRHTLRQDSRFDGAGIAPLPAICAINVINYNGSGDREVIRFVEGLWVTKVAWSPDGTQIAFDLAPQQVLNGFNSQLGDPTQSSIHVVNADGSNPRQLVAAPAAYPSWGAGVTVVVPPTPPTISIRPNGDQFDLVVGQLAVGTSFVVEGTTTLNGWGVLNTYTANATTLVIPITPNPTAAFAAYRVRLL
ncbi:MAG TPA: hypothetical protein VMB21_19655 [Candidatus Limnocylindria bacterium]|nr:hypothetical protein [Candidatus Limnocylindria bacterium]